MKRTTSTILAALVVGILVLLSTSGCLSTTMSLERTKDGVLRLKQPKDTVIERLVYSIDPTTGATSLTIEGYSSAANVQGMQVQADALTGLVKGLAEGAVSAALKQGAP